MNDRESELKLRQAQLAQRAEESRRRLQDAVQSLQSWSTTHPGPGINPGGLLSEALTLILTRPQSVTMLRTLLTAAWILWRGKRPAAGRAAIPERARPGKSSHLLLYVVAAAGVAALLGSVVQHASRRPGQSAGSATGESAAPRQTKPSPPELARAEPAAAAGKPRGGSLH